MSERENPNPPAASFRPSTLFEYFHPKTTNLVTRVKPKASLDVIDLDDPKPVAASLNVYPRASHSTLVPLPRPTPVSQLAGAKKSGLGPTSSSAKLGGNPVTRLAVLRSAQLQRQSSSALIYDVDAPSEPGPTSLSTKRVAETAAHSLYTAPHPPEKKMRDEYWDLEPRWQSKKTIVFQSGSVRRNPYESKRFGDHDLSEEQAKVLELVKTGENVFFTGSAGTGKSFLLRRIISYLKETHGSDQVAITAPTGIAAVNIGGCTLHSFAGFGLGKGSVLALVAFIKKNRRAVDRWKTTQYLVIDEISMVDAEMFDKLNAIAQDLKGKTVPFGGIQLIICGDFLQLPPVDRTPKFCFESASWGECVPHTIKLSKVFRQKEQSFVDLLNELRMGIVTDTTVEILKRLSRTVQYPDDGIEPTRLYPLRAQVDSANLAKLKSLQKPIMVFKASDSGDEHNVKKLMDSCMAPTLLELCIGAQVMLLKNKSPTLVNGLMGRVLDFDKGDGRPIIQFVNGQIEHIQPELWLLEVKGVTLASRSQLPLCLSYALSIHKSQGQTLDRVIVDLQNIFETGQAYVAISRATSIDRIQILNFEKSKIKAHPRVAQFYEHLKEL